MPNDPELTPKPDRPRDELGRPLPSGSANRLHLPDFDALSVELGHSGPNILEPCCEGLTISSWIERLKCLIKRIQAAICLSPLFG